MTKGQSVFRQNPIQTTAGAFLHCPTSILSRHLFHNLSLLLLLHNDCILYKIVILPRKQKKSVPFEVYLMKYFFIYHFDSSLSADRTEKGKGDKLVSVKRAGNQALSENLVLDT